MFRKFFLIFWGIVIALEFLISPNTVKAEKQYQTIPGSACEFQPPAASRVPTMESIRIDYMILGDRNISKDLSFSGLHRWKDNEWPGVDYLVPTTVPFKNGGTVDNAGWDDVGGGYSLFIRGEGPCEGWYVFIGHLNYNPGTRFKQNQHIGPEVIIGEPGCSGFELDCQDKGLKIQPHNHYTLGYTQNVFNFTDGTTPAFVKDHYWIHPSRVEGNATPSTNLVSPTTSSDDLALEFSKEGFVDQTNGPKLQLPVSWTTPKLLPFYVPFWAYLVTVISIIVLFTKHYKPLGFAGLIITTMGVFFFYSPANIHAKELTPQVISATATHEDDFEFNTEIPATSEPSESTTHSGISLARLDAKQNQTLDAIISIGLNRNVPERYILAAIATGLSEDNLYNSDVVRDSDSQNWRQERSKFYADDWALTGGSLNLDASVNRFYDECYELDKNQSAGRLAADVQRPNILYRGRYQSHMAEAESLYREWISVKLSQ